MRRLPAIAALIPALLATGVAAQQFKSPSGNIVCMIMSPDPQNPDYFVRCDIADYTPVWDRPPQGCDLDWGGVLLLAGRGPAMRGCVGDTIANPGAPVLDYGHSVIVPGMTCTMQKSGITCANDDGHGFVMSRASQRLF